jgi:hypothetical protein
LHDFVRNSLSQGQAPVVAVVQVSTSAKVVMRE